MKNYADKKSRAKVSDIKVGDIVLIRQRKTVISSQELITIFLLLLILLHQSIRVQEDIRFEIEGQLNDMDMISES